MPFAYPVMLEVAGKRCVVIGDDAVRVSQAALRPYPGANWRIITVLPEEAFLSSIEALVRADVDPSVDDP